MARYRRNVEVMERVAEEVLEAAPPRRAVRFGGKKATAAAATTTEAAKRGGRRVRAIKIGAPIEVRGRFDVTKEARKAIEKARKAHKMTITLPNGETMTVEGYATRRAANIDGKAMMLAAKRVMEEGTGIPVRVGTVRGGPSDQRKRTGRKPSYKMTSRDLGYTFGFSGGGKASIANPARMRFNTHLAVGTRVDYKGKAAKVVKQHPKDKYTIRFDATGAEMISPGFILKRR